MDEKEPRIIAAGKHVQLVEQNGWEYAQRRNCTGIIVIVAVTPENKLLLVEQRRPPVRKRVVELPAGLAGDIVGQEDEPLTTAAARELVEETGYAADAIETLFCGPPSPGISDELLTFVRASGLRRVAEGGGDSSEDIEVHEIALDEAPGWLDQRSTEPDTLVDPKVYAGLYFALNP